MYVRNLLQSGDFAVPCPMGLPVTLNYDNRGVLCKVLMGLDRDTAEAAPGYVLAALHDEEIVPKSLISDSGLSWVCGYLYSPDVFYKGDGKVPDAGHEMMLAEFKQAPEKFKFFAIHAVTASVAFTTPNSIRTWLAVNHFVPLTGWLIPYKHDEKILEKLFNTRMLQFKYPYISGFGIYRKGVFSWVSSELRQLVIKFIDRRMLENGEIVAECHGEAETVTLNYAEAVQFGLTSGSVLLLDANNQILATDNPDRAGVPAAISCPICGKNIDCSKVSGPVRCSDPHCLSLLYPDVVQFLRVFKLPELSYDQYLEHVFDHSILCVTDVLDLPEYKEFTLSCTAIQLLRATVPETVVRDASLFSQILNACRGSVSTLRYYLAHADGFSRELRVTHPELPRFRSWISDPYNLSTVDCMFDHSKVSVTSTVRAFEGPQILRGRKFYLTGTFAHGTKDLVSAIFGSYGAECVASFDENTDLIVVGTIKEDVDGGAIQFARRNQIPVKEESEIFEMYEIDKDLATNLVYN